MDGSNVSDPIIRRVLVCAASVVCLFTRGGEEGKKRLGLGFIRWAICVGKARVRGGLTIPPGRGMV